MSVNQTVYDRLILDIELKGLLAASSINSAMPAIYEAWAPPNTEMPYINLMYSTFESNHWGKRDTTLIAHIFTAANTETAETIKDRLITILDRQKITLENDNSARIHSNREEMIMEPTPNIVHWEIEFSVLYWRQSWFLDPL